MLKTPAGFLFFFGGGGGGGVRYFLVNLQDWTDYGVAFSGKTGQKSNKNSTRRMFHAKNISAKSYVRDIRL